MGVLRSLALLLVSALLSVCLAEGLLRLVAPQPASWLDVYRRHPALPFPALLPNVEREVDAGEGRWTILTDADGLRIGRAPVAPGLPLALALGDSFTFGQGVQYEDSFVARLAQDPGGFRWRNAGHGGYGPQQYRQVLEYLLEQGLDPEILLVGIYLGNDFHDCVWDKDVPVEGGVAGAEPGLRDALKRSLHLYRLLARGYHRLGLAPTSHAGSELYDSEAWSRPPLARAEPIFRAEIERIAAIAAQRGTPLLVVVIPTQLSVDSEAGRATPVAVDGTYPVRRVGAILDSLEIRWVDAMPALVDLEDAYFVHDGHLTRLGHRAVADLLAPEVAGLLEATR
jgi:hypothetical protein